MEDFNELMEEFADEFYGGKEDYFRIDSDAKAEWAIRKIAEEEEERDRLDDVCQQEIEHYKALKERYDKRCEDRTANLRWLLQEYFYTVKPKETKTQQKYELPSGSLVLKKASSDYVADDDKLRDWLVNSKMDAYLKTVITPKWAQVKKQLMTTEDGSIVFGETGEIIPEGCVTIESKPARFEVKAK